MVSGPRAAYRLPNLAGLLAWMSAFWTIFTTLAAVFAASCDLPYQDEWDTWMTWLKQGYSASWFFSLHNDHRIATTRLLFALDHLLFQGRIWPFQLCSVLIQVSLVLLLWRWARRAASDDARDRWVLGAAIACCLFSGQQFINFVWGFQVQFFLVYALGAAALAALWLSAEAADSASRSAWLGSCLLLAAGCSYSMVNGIVIWPILLLTAAWLKMGRLRLGLLASSGILLVAIYFHGWHPSKLDAPAPLWRIVVFALAHAGTPVVPLVRALGGGNSDAGVAATVAGLLCLGYAALTWLRVWTRRGENSAAQVVLSHFAVFVAAASFAIAAGRAHLPLPEAFRSRYITPSYILWACLLILAWPRLSRVGARRLRWMVAFALLVGIAPYQMSKLREARAHGAGLRQAALALAVNVDDPGGDMEQYLRRPFSNSEAADQYLRQRRLTIYSAEWTQWTGRPLASLFSIVAAAPSQGGFRSTTPLTDPLRPGWRISGWARDPRTHWIVLADAGGVVQGLAVASGGRWLGYARSGPASVTAYAVGEDGKSVYGLGMEGLRPQDPRGVQ